MYCLKVKAHTVARTSFSYLFGLHHLFAQKMSFKNKYSENTINRAGQQGWLYSTNSCPKNMNIILEYKESKQF